jgi:hypothetical protein
MAATRRSCLRGAFGATYGPQRTKPAFCDQIRQSAWRLLFTVALAMTALFADAATLTSILPSPAVGLVQVKPGYAAPQGNYQAFDVTGNLAYSGGAALPAVANSFIAGHGAIHHPTYTNDGNYGNGASWIGTGEQSWVKIDLGGLHLIDRVQFGRDRLPGGFNDRDPGQFTIAFAASENAYADGDDSSDASEYTNVFDSAPLGFSGSIIADETILATLTEPAWARYVKLVVGGAGVAIDEIEIRAAYDFAIPTPLSVELQYAGPDDPAFFVGERAGNGGVPAPPTSITLESLDLIEGSEFTLDPHETLVLTTGPLYIGPGSVFTGNGVIQGGVINAGLLRIPIVRIATVNQAAGGVVAFELPAPPPGMPVIIGGGGGVSLAEGTMLAFSPPEVDEPTPEVVIDQQMVASEGVLRFDASLEITGSFEQRETGALRMFIAGDDQPGVNYSQLKVGEGVELGGALELVFEPALFDEFDYLPQVGDTFDLITSPAGITIAGGGLTLRNFIPASAQSLIFGATLTSFNSGIAADPDQLLEIEETLFRVDLVEQGTVLRATLIAPLVLVPEPAAAVLLLIVAAVLRPRARHSLREVQ